MRLPMRLNHAGHQHGEAQLKPQPGVAGTKRFIFGSAGLFRCCCRAPPRTPRTPRQNLRTNLNIVAMTPGLRSDALGSLRAATLTCRVKVGKVATLKDPGLRGRSPMLLS